MTKLNLYGEAPGSIVDGPGIRYGVFVQGCPHKCPGCHNEDSQDFGINHQRSIDEVLDNILSAPSTQGVTFSGGEPFEQAEALAQLGQKLKEHNINIWCYTGYVYENLHKKKDADKLLSVIDVLVDGPFVESKKSMDCLYRGSSNQRLIDMNETRKQGKIVLWTDEFTVPKKPSSW